MAKQPSRKTQPFGALIEPGRARLTLVSGAAPAGMTFSLDGKRHEVGREGTDIPVPEDPFVSAKHASFRYESGKLVVHDEGSANGVYLRVRGPHLLSHGDMFRTGRQYFRFEEVDQKEEYPTEDGTLHFVSPRRKGSFRVVQVLEGGTDGLSATASNDEVVIGGEGAGIAFTSDPFLSEQHARIYKNSTGTFSVEDLGSTNGTYVRVEGKETLNHGDYVALGDEIFRVDIT